MAACRAALLKRGIPGERNWRNTVVTTGPDRFVVRVWVAVPEDVARPYGTPDYVFVVAEGVISEQ